jgi:hypothetical protein
MAVSPAHRWGQIIGEVMEAAVLPMLRGMRGASVRMSEQVGQARPAVFKPPRRV